MWTAAGNMQWLKKRFYFLYCLVYLKSYFVFSSLTSVKDLAHNFDETIPSSNITQTKLDQSGSADMWPPKANPNGLLPFLYQHLKWGGWKAPPITNQLWHTTPFSLLLHRTQLPFFLWTSRIWEVIPSILYIWCGFSLFICSHKLLCLIPWLFCCIIKQKFSLPVVWGQKTDEGHKGHKEHRMQAHTKNGILQMASSCSKQEML